MRFVQNMMYAGALTASLFLYGCGGSGTASSSGSSDTTVTGSVTAAPVASCTVTVKDTSGNTVAGPVNCDSSGGYSVTVPAADAANDMVFISSGGSFTDEASGTASVTAGEMGAYVSGGGLSSGGVHINPVTAIVRKMVEGGKTLTQAKSDFESEFGFAPDETVQPADATNPPSGATAAQKLMGLRVAAFSQMTMDLGLNPDKQFELLDALADDMADGAMNGRNGNGGVSTSSGTALKADVKNSFSRALVTFRSGNRNQSGLGPDEMGAPPFATTALTDSYKVVYTAGSMAAMQGKSMFTLTVTNKTNDTPVTGLTISLTPKMYMSTKTHSTPVYKVTDNNDGTYACEVYYLMPSAMSGTRMGYWELAANVGGETTYFYPSVGMAMYGTARTVMKNADDDISMMGNTQDRQYFIFRRSLSGSTGNHSFSVFIAAQESMMSYPALKTGISLTDENSASWSVNSVSVQASTDGTSFSGMTDNGDGTYSITGLTGLTDGTEGSVYVKLSINGTQYTTNGLAVDGSNDYATFTVTP